MFLKHLVGRKVGHSFIHSFILFDEDLSERRKKDQERKRAQMRWTDRSYNPSTDTRIAYVAAGASNREGKGLRKTGKLNSTLVASMRPAIEASALYGTYNTHCAICCA